MALSQFHAPLPGFILGMSRSGGIPRKEVVKMKEYAVVLLGALLRTLWTKAKKRLATWILNAIVPTWDGARCGCSPTEEKSRSRTLEVQIKTEDGRTVTVKMDEDLEWSDPEARKLADSCRIRIGERNLKRLLCASAESADSDPRLGNEK